MSKWISRKLLVALVSVGAIVWGIHKGDPAVEGQIVDKGALVADAAITLITMAYLVMQGLVDRKPEPVIEKDDK